MSWWPGSVKPGGLHIHHLVFGIVLLLIAGFLGFALAPNSPWTEILAVLFGVGAGLTLDEFALWLHLEDVYWAEEGRRSVDAVIIAALLAGLVIFGFVPLELNQATSVGVAIALVVGVLALCALAIAKGKFVLGLVGLFVPLASIVAALRLAKPGSPWARWRYEEGSRKLERASRRYAKVEARRTRLRDLIGGAPDVERP